MTIQNTDQRASRANSSIAATPPAEFPSGSSGGRQTHIVPCPGMTARTPPADSALGWEPDAVGDVAGGAVHAGGEEYGVDSSDGGFVEDGIGAAAVGKEQGRFGERLHVGGDCALGEVLVQHFVDGVVEVAVFGE